MTWSSGRRAANVPKVCTNGTNPSRASAPATPIMFASAIPAWMNRSGYAPANRSISHCLLRSPVRHTMSSRSFASATSDWPYGFSTVGYGGWRSSGIAALQFSGQLRFGRGGELGGKLDEVPVRVGGQAVKSVGGRGPIYQNVGFVPLIRSGQGLDHGVNVVPVDVLGGPAERLPL